MLACGAAKATLRLGRSGHLIEYRTKHSTLVEIVTSKFAQLPSQLCSIDRRLIGYRTHTVEGQGVRYHCSYQLESAPVDLYLALHRELETDARTSTLAAAIPGASTASPDCLSLLKCDLLARGTCRPCLPHVSGKQCRTEDSNPVRTALDVSRFCCDLPSRKRGQERMVQSTLWAIWPFGS